MNGRVVRRSGLVVFVVATAGGVLATSVAGQSTDEVTANRFSLTADGYEVAIFDDLKEATEQVDVTEYVAASDKDAALSKVAATPRPVLTLKRPATRSRSLWGWQAAMLRGEPAGRRSVTLTGFNSEGKPVVKFLLEDAFPSKITVGGVKAGGSEALIETVTLVATTLQRLSLQ